MQPHVWMGGEEGIDALVLVSGEIITNQVNFLMGRTTFHHVLEKGNELLAGVARRSCLALGPFWC